MEKKRNALIAASLVALLSGIAKAHFYHHEDLNYRTRWSMVKQGLISGDWKWSMYAHGLVPGEVRYSPYAFSPNHPTGLVWDNNGGHSFCSINQQGVLYSPSPNNANNPDSSVAFLIYSFPVAPPERKTFEEIKAEEEAKHAIRMENLAKRKETIAKRKEARRNDPINEIYQYLSKTNVSFKNHAPLILDGEVTGTTFFLDKRRVIQYVNIDKIKKQKGFARIKACKDYLDSLSNLTKEYTEKGWSICFVTFDEGKINGLESLL